MRRSSRVRFAPTFPPPAIRTYISGGPLRPGPYGLDLARADGLDQRLDRGIGRADRAQPTLPVELGAGRVEDAHDDAVDRIALLGHLADDAVRVVRVGAD